MLPKHARNHKGAASAASSFEANLFGPQTRWSSLLGRRESLQNEITRGRRHLEQLRKDLAECGALVQPWRSDERTSGRNERLGRRHPGSQNDSIEEYLSGWLLHLEDQLGAVVAEIQAIEQQNAADPIRPEQSMYELLRAAG